MVERDMAEKSSAAALWQAVLKLSREVQLMVLHCHIGLCDG